MIHWAVVYKSTGRLLTETTNNSLEEALGKQLRISLFSTLSSGYSVAQCLLEAGNLSPFIPGTVANDVVALLKNKFWWQGLATTSCLVALTDSEKC